MELTRIPANKSSAELLDPNNLWLEDISGWHGMFIRQSLEKVSQGSHERWTPFS